jgi:HlyD family secretion protein
MKNKKVLRYLIIAVVILLILLVVGKKAGWFGKSGITKISTELAIKRTITEIITANGKIQPETEVKISAEISGEVVEVNVKEGQQVKAGDLLVKIKPDIYLSNLERMKAALNSSKSNLANSEARFSQTESQFKQTELSYKRSKTLWDQKAISQSEWEAAQSQYEVAKAEVDAARQSVNAARFAVNSSEASLKESQENLTKTTIYAPMDGTVSRLNVEKGERVLGTIQMSGTEILRIANLNAMEVVVDVNENDIVRVKNYDTATVEVDAYMGKKFKGIVTEIANSATSSGTSITDQVTNFQVKILLLAESYKELIPKDNPSYFPFRPGMSATVDIQTQTRYNVISIPIQAVTTRADSTGEKKEGKVAGQMEQVEGSDVKDKRLGNQKEKKAELKEVVFLYEKGKSKMVYVKTGIQDQKFIEITSGINEMSEIISAPYNAISKKLKDKMEVEKVPVEKLYEGEKQ